VSFAPPPCPLFTTIEPRSSATRLMVAGGTCGAVGGQERVGERWIARVAYAEPRTRSPPGSNSGSLVTSAPTQLPKMSSSTAVPGSDRSGGR
jgi:hypothetical protein